MKRWRVTEIAFAWMGATSFLTGWFLRFWLLSEMPTQPVGNFTIASSIDGRTIYVSRLIDVFQGGLLWGGLGLFALAVLIDAFKDPFNWRGSRRKK